MTMEGGEIGVAMPTTRQLDQDKHVLFIFLINRPCVTGIFILPPGKHCSSCLGTQGNMLAV